MFISGTFAGGRRNKLPDLPPTIWFRELSLHCSIANIAHRFDSLRSPLSRTLLTVSARYAALAMKRIHCRVDPRPEGRRDTRFAVVVSLSPDPLTPYSPIGETSLFPPLPRAPQSRRAAGEPQARSPRGGARGAREGGKRGVSPIGE